MIKIRPLIIFTESGPEPPVPTLPPYTLRLKFTEGVTPTFRSGTGTQVSSSPNIWDLTYENATWTYLLDRQRELLEVIAAGDTSGVQRIDYAFRNCSSLTSVALFDTSNISSMYYAFGSCTSLTTVPLFDTGKVTNMNSTFRSCTSLTAIPLFNTNSLTTMNSAFRACSNVQTGALALYQRASSKPSPPSHSYTFTNCGSNTTTGAAELAQIPNGWGGTGA